jgi:hypothetical protein
MWAQQNDLALFAGGVECSEFVGAEEAVREREGKSRVLIMGSSRMRDGVVPAVLAQELRLSEEQVTNVSYAAGTVYDLLLMLRRKPSVMDGVEVVIVDAEPWSLNDLTALSRRTHFLRYATLTERFAYRTGNMRDTVEAVGSFVWPYLVDRRSLMQWLGGPAAHGVRPAPRYGERPAQYSPLAAAQEHMSEFSFSNRMAEMWQEAAAALNRRGVRMLVVQPPANTIYITWIKQHQGGAYLRYRTFIQGLSAPGVLVRLYEMPSELGMQDDVFADYGHFTREGAERFSRHLAGLVRHWDRSVAEASSVR